MSGRGEVEADESGETQLAKIAITTLKYHLSGNAQVASIRTEDRPLIWSELIDICTLPQLGRKEDHVGSAAVHEEGGVGAQIAARTLSER